MMPISMRRKTCGMEKVENPYCTAPVQNESINTAEQLGSRLRDAVRANRMARAVERRAPLGEGLVAASIASSAACTAGL
jgi:hypothetical protein